MKNVLLILALSLGFIGSVNATAEIPVCTADCGGFGTLSTASQLVGLAAVGLVTVYAIEQNKFDCTIIKTAPLPGTNYTNEKSTCVEK